MRFQVTIPMMRRLLAALLLGGVLGCQNDGASSVELSSGGGGACRPWANSYMQVRRDAPTSGVRIFADEYLSRTLGYVGPSTPVIRELTKTLSTANNLNLASSSCSPWPENYMQIRDDAPSSGVRVFADEHLSQTLGYVGPGVPVIRELTKKLSGAHPEIIVVRLQIRGGSLANQIAYTNIVNVESRSGQKCTEATARNEANGSGRTGEVTVMRVNVRGGAFANRTGWTNAVNLEARSGQDCGTRSSSAQPSTSCPRHSVYLCDSGGCRCRATGVAPESVVGNFIIETVGTLGLGALRSALVGLGRRSVALGGGAAADEAVSGVARVQDSLRANLDAVLAQINPGRNGNANVRQWLQRCYFGQSCDMNCAGCTLAVDATLHGRSAIALPGQATSVQFFEELFQQGWRQVVDHDKFIPFMADLGVKKNGQAGVLLIGKGPGQVGHFLNILSKNGKVYFLDGQLGKTYVEREFYDFYFKQLGFKDMYLILTN